jgi:hypothetical protein
MTDIQNMCDNIESDSSYESDACSQYSTNSADITKIIPGDATLDESSYIGCNECNEAPLGKGFEDETGVNLYEDVVCTQRRNPKREALEEEIESDIGRPAKSQTPKRVRNSNKSEIQMSSKRDTGFSNSIGGYMAGLSGQTGGGSSRRAPSLVPNGDVDDNGILGEDNLNNIGDGDNSPPSVPELQTNCAKRSEICWLCTFCTDTVAKEVTLFIASNISSIDTLHMASQIKDEILTTYPVARGARKRDILRHIREHMLNPNVKMASVIRSLVTVAESLRTSIHQRDPENDCVIMDLKSVDMYLKVLTQIANAYKMDSSKLLFSHRST